METIKIDGTDVEVSKLPPALQQIITSLARQRSRIKSLTEELEDCKLLHNVYNEMLKVQVIEYLKQDTPI